MTSEPRKIKRAIITNKFGNVCFDCAKWETVNFDDLRTGDFIKVEYDQPICEHMETGVYQLGEQVDDAFEMMLVEGVPCKGNAQNG